MSQTVLVRSLTRFAWVSNHYDVHLNGTCWHDGKLCEFQALDNDGVKYQITPLGLMGRIKWRLRQRLFEYCVGEHWPYPQILQGARFTNRHPTMYKLYYKLQKLL